MINEQKPVNQIQLARAVINTSAKAMNQYAMKIDTTNSKLDYVL